MLALFREIKRLEALRDASTDDAERSRLAGEIWNLECDAQTHYE